jgi:flavin reductase (DIM6/NTAB) family NADH-FMN oxidoreductase RutF
MKKSVGAKVMPFPAPVWCVGTYDQEGRPNVMTASWAGICCSEPPCVAVSIRKACYTWASLAARQAFTISVPSERYARVADHFGIVSGRDEDKFAKTGLTPARGLLVDAPYVDEFPVVMECRLLHTHELGLHTQFIGQVMDVRIEEDVMGPGGHPDSERLKLFVLLDGYRGLGAHVGKPFAMGKEL